MAAQTPSHLNLSVQPGAQLPYCVCGDFADQIGRHHACARDAESAVHDFCRQRGYTATVTVYTPRCRLWKTDEIAADGTVASTTPRWLRADTEAA